MVEIRPGGDSQLSKNPEPNKGLSITEQQRKGSGAAVIRELQNAGSERVVGMKDVTLGQ